MKITVAAGSWARRYMVDDSVEFTMPEHSTVADVLKLTALPQDETGMTMIEGKNVAPEHPVTDGDVLKVYPVIIGG